MIDQLKDLKDTYDIVKSTIDKFREPKQEMVVLSTFMQALANEPQILFEKVDKDYKRYFYEDFTHGLIKRLLREKSNDEKYLEAIASILESYMKLLVAHLKQGSLNQGFLDGTKSLFEFDCLLHCYNYQISEEQLNQIRLAGQAWRKDLEVGQMIDAVQDDMPRCSGWSQAQIAQINGDLLQIQFLCETRNCDKMVDRNSMLIAPFQTKSKQIFDWKQDLRTGDVVDAYDKNMWNKSTILDIQEQDVAQGRTIKVAHIAYRVYQEKGSKSDERGAYEGYSNRYDEWMPLYSPRIQPFHTKTQRTFYDDVDIDDDLDNLFPTEDGQERNYVVPRNRRCTSKVYIHMMNIFGNLGGFELLKQIIIDACNKSSSEENQIDLNIIGTLIDMASRPYVLYHKDFQKDYSSQIVDLAQRAIRSASDKSLRDVNKDKVEVFVRSIDNLMKRNKNKTERDREIEILKLEICLLCLKSNLLEKRIQGIKDLNQVIKNNRIMTNKTIPNQQLIQWMKENNVLSIIFDIKKTHLQIVQRSSEILKLLLQEDQLDETIFEMFWSLSKTDYRVEVYKILNDIAFSLKKQHFQFIYNQLITSTNVEKMALDDFSCLNELSKFAKDEEFKENVNRFFWDLIVKQQQQQEGKSSQMIVTAMNFVRSNRIQIYKKPVQQQQSMNNERIVFNSNTIDENLNVIVPNIDHEITEQDKTFETQVLQAVINNLRTYCALVNEKIRQQPDALQEQNRKKLLLINQKYSHHEEIDERLQFIKYLCTISSNIKITKQELNAIYQLLVLESKVASDAQEFLIWCKSLCESNSISKSILDLNEVGEFFNEKMQSKELDLKHLPVVGFEFLQHYFLSVNEKHEKLFKSSNNKQNKRNNINSLRFDTFYPQNSFNNNWNSNKKKSEDEDKQPVFKLIKPPSELEQLDIVWNIALQSEDPKVTQRAINFLIRVYYQLDEDLDKQKISIQGELIDKCMSIIKTTQDEFTLNRAIEIIKNVIYEAEKKGTGDVQPHNAVLKGELLEKIQIRNRATSKKSNIWMSIYSNTTVWEFKKEVAKQLDLGTKYLKLERSNGQVIQDLDHGKTLAELGIQAYEVLNAYKLFIEEQIANAPLIGPDNKLTEKAKQIFNEWFEMYSDGQGFMHKEHCCNFIRGCTGELPGPNDERVAGLFAQYDGNRDGKIERHEFFKFYENSSRNKPDTVRENLRAHNIRNDLKKLSEIQEESSFNTEDMPRYKISENQEYFDIFMTLLDRQDSVSQTSWDLIQMLATNQQLYRRVLELKNAIDENTQKINWEKFFDTQSDYKLLYTLQIIEAVMEEGEAQNLERIMVIQDSNVAKNVPVAPPATNNGVIVIDPPAAQNKNTQQEEEKQSHPILKKNTSVLKDDEQNQKLKSEWTSMFLNHDGIQYIMKVFMEKEINVDNQNMGNSNKNFSQTFELKHIAFLLKLLRIFIMAAFSTSKEKAVYQAAQMVRKSSMTQEDEFMGANEQKQDQKEVEPTEGARFKELQSLLKGPLGQQIIDQIDYKLLQNKILRITRQILNKNEMIFEDKLIIENALSLWVGCILHKNDLFKEFIQFKCDIVKSSDDFILQGLLYCPYEKIREEFKASISSITEKLSSMIVSEEDSPLRYFLQLLSENFDKISNSHSKQYFDLFCKIVDIYFEYRNLNNQTFQITSFNPEILLSQTIDKIKEYHQKVEELNSQMQDNDEEDQEGMNRNAEVESVYIGLIQLSGKIIDNFDISLSERIIEEKQLIEEVFTKFLFATVLKDGQKMHEKKEIKIQPKKKRQANKTQILGKKSKDACYKLINNLIQRSPKLMNNFLDKCMLPLMSTIRRPEGWNFSPNNSGSSGSYGGMMNEKYQKYVGLRNLGCICYMNSMLQQFFMIPAFRYNLLCVDDKKPEDVKEYRSKMIDDNVLHQLQKLMAHLELSERNDYNPFEFCFAFKDLDGNPTNTGEQKDAQEFLNLAFDRIENLLRGTSRKYLLQSVFGGQTCSQLVCQECGKVTNRIEDFYNLSLTVKDTKSMHESLQKLVDGEVINDFTCSGCQKKVDISKRTLISQTPNVLIVHLQRILFNFETFRTDKLNTFFEFPYQLDLKPYSFYEVMKREGRIKDKSEDDEEETKAEVKDSIQRKTEEEKKDAEEEVWPEQDDCFEYKLVGATVHSGTAQSGHYWSYINTCRGYMEPDESNPSWNSTENDAWMEFNDSRVSEFNFEKLRDECFGDQQNKGSSSGYDDGWSSWGSYGKSAYMLVYERRKKRPIKVVVDQVEAEEAKKKGENVIYNEKTEEYIKHIDYREGVEDIAPNQIYIQVCEDNKKFEFDNDIYSAEFFDFLKNVLQAGNKLQSEYNQQDQQDLKQLVSEKVLSLGKKSVLEILSRCYNNQGISNIIDFMIDGMKANPNLSMYFMNQCYLEDRFEQLLQVILECPDMSTRANIGNLIKFVINQLKQREKDYLFATDSEEIEYTTQDNQVIKRTEEIPRALSARFIIQCIENLNTLIAKNWSRFDNLLDIMYVFAAGDEQLDTDLTEEEKKENERVGLEFYFKQGFVGKACDFILGKRSPLSSPNDRRYEMGGSYGYSSPNFSSVVKIITKMITNEELLQQYPLSDIEKKLLLQQDFLKTMLGQNQGSKYFGKSMASVCRGNYSQSKKVAKIFIRLINSSSYDNVKNYLKALKPFLLIDDEFKKQRVEWIFGFPQIVNRREYMDNNRTKYGVELIQKMHDEAYIYVSPLLNGPSEEALLSQLLKCKGRMDQFAHSCLKEMLSLMSKDDYINQYIYNMIPHNYQFSRYTDWIKSYLDTQRSELAKNAQYAYMQQKLEVVMKALKHYAVAEEKWKVINEQEKAQYDEAVQKHGVELMQDYLAYTNPDVIQRFPPQLIIGRQTTKERDIAVYDQDENVSVTIQEMDNEYNYSNPTHFFNLSVPHIEVKTGMYQTMSYLMFKRLNYEQEKTYQTKEENEKKRREQEVKEEQGDPQTQEEVKEQVEEYKEPEVRDWFQTRREGIVLYKVVVQNKSRETVKYKLSFKPKDPNNSNVMLPVSELSETLYQSESKCVGYFQRINPVEPWTEIDVQLSSIQKTFGNTINTGAAAAGRVMNGNQQFQINVYDTTGNISISDQGQVMVSLPKTVDCLNCRVPISSSATKCPNCGVFNASGQTYDPQDESSIYHGY